MNDSTYFFYWIALILATYGGVCFIIWSYVTGSYKDIKYRLACMNVIILIVSWIYILIWNIYARGLRDTNHLKYHYLLSSDAWGFRYLPIVVLLLFISIKISTWICYTVRVRMFNKRQRRLINDKKTGTKN